MNILSEHTVAFFGSAFVEVSPDRNDSAAAAAKGTPLGNAARWLAVLPSRCCTAARQRLRIWCDYGYVMRERDSMTDHDLHDVGIKRDGILDCAWSEACRRHPGAAAR